MLFSSNVFLFVFFPIVLFLYYFIIKKREHRNILLFVASIGFYAWGEIRFVFILLLSILANWYFGILIDRHRTNRAKSIRILVAMCFFNLSVIFVFKYLMFSIELINLIGDFTIKVPKIALPIGISFFTFQAISYVIDVYRNHGEVQKNPLNVGLYISFFPQLIAGPIVRYQTVADQINHRVESVDDVSIGITRFILGLSKKVLLSNSFAIIADAAFSSNPANISIAFAWLGAIAYSLQIFFDFSGYSDMAIGLGKVFGFHFDENFNYPYISKSVSEFWRRWHISLGSWFRDYVYFPLGGSRVKSKFQLLFNLFVVWLLTGIWHGANMTFVVWGLYFFILIAVEKLSGYEKRWQRWNGIKLFFTLVLVIIGWVVFRSDSMTSALHYLSSMFGLEQQALMDPVFMRYVSEYGIYFLCGILFSTPCIPWLKQKTASYSKYTGIIQVVCYALIFLLAITYLIKGTYNPFIYFNF